MFDKAKEVAKALVAGTLAAIPAAVAFIQTGSETLVTVLGTIGAFLTAFLAVFSTPNKPKG